MTNLHEAIGRGDLNAEIGIVITSNNHCKGITRGEALGLPMRVLKRKSYDSVEAFSADVFGAARETGCGLMCLGGFLSLLRIPVDFEGKVMNIHPGLLPSFGGKGFYGHHVHEAVLAAGCKVSGCTIHFADNEYDNGPIIVQRTVPVEEGDTADDLAARVFAQECIAYPEAVKLFAEGRLKIDGQVVRIAPPE